MSGLTPERWRRISTLLDKALERPPAERRAWLDEQLADEPALRAELERLLAAAERTGGVLDDRARDYLKTLIEEAGEASGAAEAGGWIGRTLGSWRLAREVGRGGMGVVYLAERADGQFEQRVALKLVKRGLDTDEILERFQRERQILARLEHPSIARLVDGGVSEDGRPYFAMEFVEGEPITTYCDRQRSTIGERLALFGRVCETVEYAHRNLIVHRDLKPSNILVTDEGELKLVDFGIAKLLGEEPGATLVTGPGARPLTPAYAAPEQLSGEPVTTATDVYSLGVVLYELLSGRRPHGGAGTSAPELEKAVLETDPRPPSRALTPAARQPSAGGAPEPSPAEIAAARRSTPRSLARRLGGDLDAIVLAALRKEPERRYASALLLGQDLARHLEHQPILARPEGAFYRTRKFVRRHRAGVAAAAFVVAALALGLAGTLSQARAKAIEARKAEEVKDFVLSLFEATDPAEARGQEITARELLDRGAQRLESELATQPEVRAELAGVVGELYRKLGLWEPAERLLQRALDESRRLHGEESLEAAAALDRRAVLSWDRGDYAAAEATHRGVLALREKLLGTDHPLVADSLTNLASVLTDEGAYEEAEAAHRRALAIDRAFFGDESVQAAKDLSNLAVVLWHQGRYDEAEPLHRRALAARDGLLGENHPDTVASLHALASLLSTRGDYAEADELFREAIERRKAIFGPDHPEITYSLENYSILLQRRGDLAAARPVALESLEIRRRTLGPEHPELATSLNNYGVLCYRLSEFEEAERYFRQALAIWERELGREHPSVASSLNNIGMIRLELGDAVAAEPLVREGLTLRRELLGDEHQAVAQSLRNLGLVLIERRKLVEAEATLSGALELARRAYPEGHPRIAEVLVALGQAWIEQGRHRQAEPLLREALAIRREKIGEEDWRTAEAELYLGLCLVATRSGEQGRELLSRSFATLRDQRGEDHRLTRRAASALGSS